ncbi:type IV pili methyl-accepting chemotaxis transducer N-terminal domain-containing protein [Parasulfitobacter algicola]|uniref:Type IV pili methyl-accepting chemotaxis transducer N-terminal domain-containing protein n=1 Tax=Parasulfitobacter algicola TaxID=2614809 RepID=A0ABX2IWK6_9RHOB|nr:type IV pili methyl-accepting chemotaxis transducer N-terminal domain-containing protein [Sulfitobacter algicola]NSX54473.1 type IV pili methyl-accepting chemotaxis transducer N-terminal domain-containing protein [Sulfitobacter algicola]
MPNYVKIVALTAALISPAFIATHQAHAEDTLVSSETVTTRLDLGGRQRMLTQRMAKAFCFIESGINVEKNREVLKTAENDYRTVHIGMRQGNPDLKLFVERKQIVIQAWNEVDEKWRVLNKIYEGTLDGNIAAQDAASVVANMTPELLNLNNNLVVMMNSAYSDHIGGGFADAVLIDMYGRQRMLSQKVAKQVCFAHSGHEEIRAELEETIYIFEASLDAFINGNPNAGIKPAPSPEIKAQLELTKTHWDAVSSVAKSVAAGALPETADVIKFNMTMDSFLFEMNKTVQMLDTFSANQS